MNSKSQKMYSKMIAGALVASAVVVPASALAQDTTVPAQAEDITAQAQAQDITVPPTAEKDVISGGWTQSNYYNATSSSDTGGAGTTGDTAQPTVDQITVINNVAIKDKVAVSSADTGEVYKVYKADSKGKANLIGSGTVTAKNKENFAITITAKKGFEGLEHIYVTKTVKGKTESAVTKVAVTPEEVSSTPDSSKIRVTNNVGKKDSITVLGVKAKDVVSVYSSSADTTSVIGKATVKKSGAVVVSIKRGFTAIEEGKTATVYVAIKDYNKLVSTLVPVTVESEPKSTTLDTTQITVNNNVGKNKDTLTVKGLKAKEVIKVYSSDTTLNKTTQIGTAKASKLGVAIVKIKKDGFKAVTTGDVATTVFVTRTTTGKLESNTVAVGVKGDPQEEKLNVSNITFTNNVDSAHTLEVTGLTAKDVIKVYEGTTLLAKATSKAEGKVLITLKKLKKDVTSADVINVTISSPTASESEPFELTLNGPTQTDSGNIKVKNIVVNDNGDKVATVTVVGAKAKSKYTVYASNTSGDSAKLDIIGTATAKKDGILEIKFTDKKYADLKGAVVKIGLKEYDKTESELEDITHLIK